MVGGSPFERAVWGEIAKIPYGEMQTYGAIATALGDPGAARAVGTACNHNPVPVLVRCHRVVGAGGKMVGFGGGMDRKRRLLELEAKIALARLWGWEPGQPGGGARSRTRHPARRFPRDSARYRTESSAKSKKGRTETGPASLG